MEQNQFQLFRDKRFLPLFITQFTVALNDNLIKNALVILVTYRLAITMDLPTAQMILLANAIFIAPFIFLSSIAGQISDKYERTTVIKYVKASEIFISMTATYGFMSESIFIMYFALGLMGLHTTFFGPVKYAILPDQLEKDELLSANGYVEAGTFVSILLGTLLGGLYNSWEVFVVVLILSSSIIGFISSFYIPKSNNSIPELKLNYNLLSESIEIVRQSASRKIVFQAILGISWFWFIGAAFLSEIPMLCRDVFCANENVANMFLAIFSIGVGVGSFWCSKIFDNEITAKYVPITAIGISIFAIDLYFACGSLGDLNSCPRLFTLTEFLSNVRNLRILFDLFFIAAITGLYAVPLYAVMQYFSPPPFRSRVIASNNIVNAIFMIACTLLLSLLFELNFSVPSVILVISVLNLLVAFIIYRIVPETRVVPAPFIRPILRFIFDRLYRVEVKGMENFKNAGDKVVIVANHGSYIDPPLLGVYLSEKIIFAVNTEMFNRWWMRFVVMKVGRGYPIDPNNPMSTKTLINEVRKKRKVAIFPEGRVSTTGSIMKIYDGPGMIAERSGAVLLPVRIDGLEHTWFANTPYIPKRRIAPKVTITVLPPIKLDVPEDMASRDKRKYLTTKLYDIMCEMVFESSDNESSLFQSLIDVSKIYRPRTKIVHDTDRRSSYRDLIKRSFILGKYIAKITARGEYVGLMLPNSVGAVIGFYAMQAYGRVPAMINFTSGISNCQHAVDVLKLRVIYTSRKFVDKAELNDLVSALKNKCKVIFIEDVLPEITILDKVKGFLMSYFPDICYNNFMWNDFGPDSPAVALFTSGSEGVPKAVILSHKNIQSNRWQITSRFDFGAGDRAFIALPMFHCFGLTGTILMMMQGIRTFLYPSPLHYSQIPEMLYELGSTIFISTDTFLNGYSKYAHPYDFFSVKYIIAGAEKLMPDTRRLWSEKYGIRLLEGYGVTEASPVIAANSLMHDRHGTVGRFMPQMEYKIKPVEGIEKGAGILCIKGPNVMKGYVYPDNPGVIVRPTDPEFGDGWYETGDIVSVDSDGYITILGRKKRFAKIAGEMVPLSGIEEFAKQADPESNHAVMNMPDKKKGEQILLFTTGKFLNRKTMLETLKDKNLTELYLPKHFVYVDEIPVLATGKTNYRELLKMSEEYIKSHGKN